MTISETRYLKRQQPFTTSYPLAAVPCNVVAQLSIQYLHSLHAVAGCVPGVTHTWIPWKCGTSCFLRLGTFRCIYSGQHRVEANPFLAASTPIGDNATTSVPFGLA